jgi:ABC-type Co2+ transport system permease subunit
MHVFMKTAGDDVEPTLATTAVIPGVRAVANPFASTEATAAAEADQLKLPTWLVISVPLLNACATNWCVCVMEKQGCVTGSTLTEVMAGCTATVTGPLVTPAAVAVTIAVPVMGFAWASEPLQTTKAESQTPAQTLPCGEIVAMLVFVELKVNVVLTAALAEFTADTVSVTTCPATIDSVAGAICTAAMVLFADFEPPQPAVHETRRAIRAIPVKNG